MPASQARPNIEREGITFRWCSRCDEYKVLDSGNFQLMKDKRWKGEKSSQYWSRRCRVCLQNRDLKHGHYYPLARFKKHVDWMIGVVGWNDTRTRLGVSKGTLHYWMGGTKSDGKVIRRITTPNARKIIEASIQLRTEVETGVVTPLEVHASKRHCKGCGSDLSEFTLTEGCGICWERHRGRERRKNREYRQYEHERYERRKATLAA